MTEQAQHRSASIPDLIVAATARSHGLEILHYDRDFETIARYTEQPTRWIVPPGTVLPASRTRTYSRIRVRSASALRMALPRAERFNGAMHAAYDEIADWYEHEFLGTQDTRAADPIGIDQCLRALLGIGSGICLEIGCGTGVHAATIRELGWTPAGIDISTGMLCYARGRLAIARADAQRLPFKDRSLKAVVSVMVHTDMPGYLTVVSEAARVLRPGGTLVHVGVHPCFCGGFADRSDPTAVVIRPGYRDGHWTKASWTDKGVRDKVGATHFPLPHLLNAFTAANLAFERFAEGGTPTPTVLAIRARKPS